MELLYFIRSTNLRVKQFANYFYILFFLSYFIYNILLTFLFNLYYTKRIKTQSMKYLKLVIFIFIQLSSIYAEGRKYSTAHYFQNGTIYILGGTNSANNSDFASPLLTLQFNSTDLSIHSTETTNNHFIPSVGHTSHLLSSNHSITSFFGLHPPHYKNHTNNNGPSPRFRHTSIAINRQIYFIGGLSATTHQPVSDPIWTYSLSNQTWVQVPCSDVAMAGHVTFLYQQWIISCFSSSSSCWWHDMLTSQSTLVAKNHSTVWPDARKDATITQIDDRRYIVFGGENQGEVLQDLWQLDLDTPFIMTWTQLKSNGRPRSGHVGILIDDLILYYGGQESALSMASEPLYWNITSQNWINTDKRVTLHRSQADLSSSGSLGGAAIGGIVAGIIVAVAIAIGFFLYKRRKTQKQDIQANSRAARTMRELALDEKIQMTNSMVFDTKPFLSLPELAVTNPMNVRISAISLGTQFKFSTEDYYTKHPTLKEEEEEFHTVNISDASQQQKGLKRLTLNLFSNHSSSNTIPKDQSGNLSSTQHKSQKAADRASLGAKSVASVQWVGFNDGMDYKGRQWRDSSSSSLHLAVKNAQRASSYYSSESNQSTPRTPMFPHHLRDSVVINYPQESNPKKAIDNHFVNV